MPCAASPPHRACATKRPRRRSTNDARAAKAAVGKLVSIAETLPATAKGRALLHDLRDDVIDGRDLIRLSETELLRPLDRQARDMILAASKRVSIVTAGQPARAGRHRLRGL